MKQKQQTFESKNDYPTEEALCWIGSFDDIFELSKVEIKYFKKQDGFRMIYKCRVIVRYK